MKRVLDAKLRDIERRVRAAKRGQDRPLSLDAPVGDGADTLGDVLAHTGDEANQALIRLAIQRAADRLSPPQSAIVTGLAAGESVTEISRRIAISRSAVYEQLKEIREAFRDEGLEEFLR